MPDQSVGIDDLVSGLRERAEAVQRALAANGVRIFALSLSPNDLRETSYWVHAHKTVDDWRGDVRAFIASSETTDEDPTRGRADGDVFNALSAHLLSLGYVGVADVVADVFEGRVTNERARVVHDPAHEEQADGFGHYGWENGRGEAPGK